MASWPGDVLVHSPSAGGQDYPDIAVHSNGTVVVVWTDYTNPADPEIYAQLLDSSGARRWTADLRVNRNTTGEQTEPQVATGASGEAVVVWGRVDAGKQYVSAQRIASNGTLMWGAADLKVAISPSADGHRPNVASNGDGTWVVVWTGYEGVDRNIYAQEIDVNGAVQWVPGARRGNADPTGYQDYPQVARNASGQSIVTWLDERVPGQYSLFAQALNGVGDRVWSVMDTRVNQNASSGVSGTFGLGLGPGETAYVTWDQTRTGATQVFGQQLDSSGVPQWGSEDRLLAGDGLSDAAGPRLAVDTTLEAGEQLVVWEQCGNPTCSDTNISARLFDGAGGPIWPFNLTVNQFTPFYQSFPVVAFNAVDSAYYVSWADDRGGNADVFAQRFTEGGLVPESGQALALVSLSGLAAAVACLYGRLPGRSDRGSRSPARNQ
ncbi:MAG TPA: hypothetical protein VI893_05805 [Thermoplasmata archaeon]|nr:hypothetical protein [Thermoplasmata archaeon]